MKTKKGTFLTSLILLFIGAILTFTSCEQDYYDPSRQEGTGSSLFGDSITVPANFDWSTMQSGTLLVKVDDRYNGKFYYQVEIFDANPIFFQDAQLLAKGVAKQGHDLRVSLDLPTELTRIYVRQVSPVRQGVVKVVDLSNKNMSVDFSSSQSVQTRSAYTSNASSQESTRAGGGDPSTIYTTPAINGVDNVELSGVMNVNLEWNAPPNYVIPEGKKFKGELTNNSWVQTIIFVEGTWENTANLNLNGLTIIVQDGGKFISNAEGTLAVNGLSQLIIAEGGEFGKAGSLMTLSQDGDNGKIINSGYLGTSGLTNIRYLYNDGDIVLDGKMNTFSTSTVTNKGIFDINNSGSANNLSLQGNFQNEGTVTVSGTMDSNNNDFILTNSGFFEVESLGSSDYSAQGTYDNYGQFVITNAANFALDFIIRTGALLEVKNLKMLNSEISIAEKAMLNVTESLTISTSGASKIIQGSDDGTSLAKIKTVTVPNYSNFQLLGNLEVECSNYNVLPESGSTVNLNTTGVDVRFVNVGETTVTIPPSDYNKGGNIVTPPETPPADPGFPIIWNGTSVTYLFEDNWPLLGDYDMNDVVMDVTPTYMTNSENKVTQLRLDVVLRALGATKRLAVGLQLDGIYPSMITNVTRSSKVGVNETVFPTDKTKGLENGQTFAVIPIFDIAFEALGKSSPEITNTIKGGGNSGSSMSVPIIVIFNTPVDIESLSIDKFNLFLVNGGYTSSRDEIHLSGYQPTDKANTSKFGAADDNSNSGRLYTSKNNMIWALAIPGSSSYPTEWTSIRLAFPQFQDWVLSGGGSNKTWYNNPDPDLVY